jgi:hypothetical protein
MTRDNVGGNSLAPWLHLSDTREGFGISTRPDAEGNASGFDYILAPPSRVLVSRHRPDAEGLISILKCLKLTIDIIFQSHFIAQLMRSNARDHANPDSGPATTSQAIPGFSRHWFFRGFYTKRVAGVHKLSEVGDMLTVIRSILCTACWNV